MSLENKKILGAIGFDTLAVALIALLVVKGFIPSRVLPIVSFCLFWANFMFFRVMTLLRDNRNSSETHEYWKFLTLMTVAGVYFAGAVYGTIVLINEHELYGLLGAVFSISFGAFCFGKAEKQVVVRKA